MEATYLRARCRLDYTTAAERRAPETAPLFHYVVVRSDLPRGIQSAMLVHAAGESSPGALPEDTHVVVLVARDELHLSLVAERLEGAGIAIVRVREPDAPYQGALMAVGVRPVRKEVVRRHVSELPLLR